MEAYRAGLLIGDSFDVRTSILDDLSTYFELEPAECVRRCIDWERWSVEEWHQSGRDSAEGLASFYQSTRSWAFDLMWYAYLQAECYAYPVGVAIAQSVGPTARGARHLDFGSGVGTTSQLFRRLGYETELADISTSLLDFARFRLERRGEQAVYLDLNTARLADNRYDVITAVDTLVHIPDLARTLGLLHRALRPGGYLFANFDVRPPTAENAWHLYSDDLPLRWLLQRTGFEPEESVDGMVTRYRRVEPAGLPHQLRGMRDAVMLRSPLRRLARPVMAALRRARRRWLRSNW
jgi:SAM-dependent methyltransferase